MSGKSLMLGIGAGLVVVGGLCSRSDEKRSRRSRFAPVASALAPSTAAASAKVVKFTIDPKGATTIDMPAPKEHIKAGSTAAAGTLEIDLANLANSRGEVKIDLTTFATHTFGNDDDATQTRHAQTWLEVGDAVSAEDREKYRWVTYAIRSIDTVSAADVTKVAPSSAGGRRCAHRHVDREGGPPPARPEGRESRSSTGGAPTLSAWRGRRFEAHPHRAEVKRPASRYPRRARR